MAGEIPRITIVNIIGPRFTTEQRDCSGAYDSVSSRAIKSIPVGLQTDQFTGNTRVICGASVIVDGLRRCKLNKNNTRLQDLSPCVLEFKQSLDESIE